MAKLTASKRASLPTREFAGPDRSFPVNDKNHARAALMDINSAPASARPRIKAAARAKLKGGGGMTEAQDAKYDRAHGIKENSARDKRQDKKMGVKQGGGGTMSRTGASGGSPTPKTKFPPARPSGSKSPNGGAKPPTRGGSKGPGGRAIQGPRGGGGKRY